MVRDTPHRLDRLEAALDRQRLWLARQSAERAALEQSLERRLARLIQKFAARLLPGFARRACSRFTTQTLDRLDRWLTRTGHDPIVPRGPRWQPLSVDEYAVWMARHEPSVAELARQRRHRWTATPTISLVIPLARPTPRLDEFFAHLTEQTYPHWEAIVVHSQDHGPQANDRRVRMLAVREPGHLLVEAMRAAQGEWLACVHPDDRLAPSALFALMQAAQAQPSADVLTTDHDTIDSHGVRTQPMIQSAWSPETARWAESFGALTLVRRARAPEPRPSYGSAVWSDLALRITEVNPLVVRVPGIHCHARHPARPCAIDYAQVVRDHLARVGEPATVLPGPVAGTCRIQYATPRPRPLVSIIIPNRDQSELLERCLRSLKPVLNAHTNVCVVENGSREPATFALYRRWERQGVRVLVWDRPFNYAAINNFAAEHVSGELLLFLNNDVEADGPGWLDALIRLAMRPSIGAVGAKLLYGDDTIQHAGVVLGIHGVAGHAAEGWPRDARGPNDLLTHPREVTAVTGACLMVCREAFERVGGFDEGFAVAYNDVDLCLALRSVGYRNLWTPEAELYHLESASRGRDESPERRARLRSEVVRLRSKWGTVIGAGDPFYGWAYRRDRADFAL